MTGLLRGVLSRPVGVLVVSVALVVMGALSFTNIPVQMMPEGFESRSLTVRASLRDSSPAEAERHVAIPIEEELATVAGIESISTRCGRDGVRISLELKTDADPIVVEADVRDRVRRVEPDLPDEVDRVRVRREGANDRPILFFACVADVERVELSDFMERVLTPRLEAVDGVARASAWGLVKRAVRIRLDQEEVSRRQLDLRVLLRRLRGDNLTSDLGDVRDGGKKAFLRSTMEFSSLDDIRTFPVQPGLELGEIADVRIGRSLDQGWSRYNGQAVVVGTIYKMAGSNTVATCRRVRELFAEMEAARRDVPGLGLRAFFDQGSVIENSLATLYKNAGYGGLLAIAILYFFFRRLRMTLLVAAAIPLSLMIAVTVLYLSNQSLNIATLMGLTLAVGMLIDNAIVVVESILHRRERGDPARQAAAAGAGEVALAVVTATLTTIAVFLPAVFAGETNARIWMASIGGPIAYALLASLAVALVLVPLGSVYLRRDRGARPDRAPSGGGRGLFASFLRLALRHRLAVVVGAYFLWASGSIPFSNLGRKGAEGRGSGPVRVMVRFPRHFELEDADRIVKKYENFVLPLRDELELDGMYARFDEYGGMFMVWKRSGSDKSRDEIQKVIREGWPHYPGVRTSLESVAEGGRTTITLEGEDARVLEATMDRIQKRLELMPAVAETQREQDDGLQELRVEIDPEAIQRGDAVPDVIRAMVGWVLRGARMRDYRSGGRDLPVLLEIDRPQNVERSDLESLLIPTDRGLKPLGLLSKMGVRNAAATVERRDGRRVAQMQVVGEGDDDRAFHRTVQGVLAATPLPPGVRFQVGGGWQELEETMDELFQALLLGVFLVFLLTGILFEAVLLPFAVVFSIPFALVGAVWALYLSGKPMDELSYLGAILLVGIVVNNAIVLVDRVQQRRREGMTLRTATATAVRDRVRPVVMTATTTIAGLLPMAIFKGGDNEIPYDTLATAVIGGLAVSTVVTLVLVPVVFTLLADLGRIGLRGARRAVTGTAPSASETPRL